MVLNSFLTLSVRKWSFLDAVMMQMEDDEIEAEAADEQEDSSGPRK